MRQDSSRYLRTPAAPPASVILPAHDEADYIGPCLEALFASEGCEGCEVIVVANGCRDATAKVACGLAAAAQEQGWLLHVIETPTSGKLNALNLGDDAARGGARVYLDADVIVSPPLLAQLLTALERGAAYASGTPRIPRAQSATTRAYARLWQTLPFVTQGVPGFGIFAMTPAGRARWGAWPDIISDDTFARLHFAPNERERVPATYDWPMVEGFARLVRVRRRQDAGVKQLAQRFPHLMVNEDSAPPTLAGKLWRLLRDPVGFVIYTAVALTVRTSAFSTQAAWARGR